VGKVKGSRPPSSRGDQQIAVAIQEVASPAVGGIVRARNFLECFGLAASQ
jgi:hypothetical protein